MHRWATVPSLADPIFWQKFRAVGIPPDAHSSSVWVSGAKVGAGVSLLDSQELAALWQERARSRLRAPALATGEEAVECGMLKAGPAPPSTKRTCAF